MSTSVAVQSADERARIDMINHHADLEQGLYRRVYELRVAVAAGEVYDLPLAGLVSHLATSVLPHAAAEEATLYRALAADPQGALFVDGMLLDHEELTDRTRGLANSRDPYSALSLAAGAAAIFAVHIRKENDLMLPALQRLDGTSLAALLHDMHEQLHVGLTATEPAEK